MKMHGPVTIEINVMLTDGDQIANAGYRAPAGRFPTVDEIRKAMDECLEGVRERLGGDWRFVTKQEFQNEVIADRFGVDGDFAVVGSDDWDPA